MMVEYFLRLALLLPLLAGLIWGSLRLTRFLQTRLVGVHGTGQSVALIETTMLSPGLKLAVVRFHDTEILLGCTRNGLVRLGDAPSRSPALASPPSSETGQA